MKLSATEIRKHLKNPDKFSFIILENTGSTNADAKEFIKNGYAENTIILADSQTNGKGRMSRKFSSPKGTGIYMSIILKPNLNAKDSVLITVAAAVAVSKAIESVCGIETTIKWVNDIFANGKKICGILAESASDAAGSELKYIILGIGINVFEPQGGFDEEIKNIAGAIYKRNSSEYQIRNLLTAEILNQLQEVYLKLQEKDYINYYREKSNLIGKEVDILKAGEIYGTATVEGINDFGALEVKYSDGKREILSSGEVSVKKKVGNE